MLDGSPRLRHGWRGSVARRRAGLDPSSRNRARQPPRGRRLARRPRPGRRRSCLLVAIEPGMEMTSQPTWCVEAVRVVLPLADGASIVSPRPRVGAAGMGFLRGSRPRRCPAVGVKRSHSSAMSKTRPSNVRCCQRSPSATRMRASGQLDGDAVAAALAAADSQRRHLLADHARYYLSWKAPPSIAESARHRRAPYRRTPWHGALPRPDARQPRHHPAVHRRRPHRARDVASPRPDAQRSGGVRVGRCLLLRPCRS
jgi:hypothetical protein